MVDEVVREGDSDCSQWRRGERRRKCHAEDLKMLNSRRGVVQTDVRSKSGGDGEVVQVLTIADEIGGEGGVSDGA